MKKLFSLLLTLVFLFSLMPVSVFAEAAEAEQADPTVTEMGETDEEALPFAEEHGFIIPEVPEATKVPFIASFSTGLLEQVNPAILISLPTVTAEEGEDGLKTIVIDFAYNGLLQVQLKDTAEDADDASQIDWSYSLGVNDFELYDYATGSRLIPEDVSSTIGEKSVSSNEMVLHLDGNEVPVSVTTEYLTKDEDIAYEDDLVSVLMSFELRYTVTVPADYDGLLLGTDTEVSYYEEGREIGDTWDDDGHVENWIFFRVEDLISEEAPAEEAEAAVPAEESEEVPEEEAPAEEPEAATPSEESEEVPEEEAPAEEPEAAIPAEESEGILPFAEQEGFLFPENVDEVEVPFVAVFSDEEVKQLNPVIKIPVPTVDCSEPDEDGFVDWTIRSEYSGELLAELPDNVDLTELLYLGSINDFELFDYYTGARLQLEPNSSTNGSTSVTAENSILNWNGEEVPISVKCEYRVDSERPVIEDDVLRWEKVFHITFTVHAPADYHGLVLGVDTVEALVDWSAYHFETDDLNREVEEVWNYDDVENWVFFLASDLLAGHEN